MLFGMDMTPCFAQSLAEVGAGQHDEKRERKQTLDYFSPLVS